MAALQQDHQQQAQPIAHLALQFRSASAAGTSASPPVKGGMKTSGTAEERFDEATVGEAEVRGERFLYVLVRDGAQGAETPVFDSGKAGPVFLVFSNREAAVLYVQISAWDRSEERLNSSHT